MRIYSLDTNPATPELTPFEAPHEASEVFCAILLAPGSSWSRTDDGVFELGAGGDLATGATYLWEHMTANGRQVTRFVEYFGEGGKGGVTS